MLYNVIKNIANVIFRLIYKIEVIGEDKLINDEKLIICSNHTHNFDVVIISILFPDQIHWMGKKELFKIKPLSLFFKKLGAFPVDRENPGLSAIKNSIRILGRNKSLGVFPEGTRVENFDIKNATSGVPLISISTKSPILPVLIETTYKPFSKVKVTVGEVFDFSESYGKKPTREEYQKYGEEVLYNIYNLKETRE